MPKPPPSTSPAWKVLQPMFVLASRSHIALYRATGGRVGGRMGRMPILLLHHVGKRSGKERVVPLNYLPDAEGPGTLAIVASKGGTDRSPAWFHNLMANPVSTVEIGRERRRVRARKASDEERARLWPRLVDAYGGYATYQTYTDRVIPVVVLEPA